MDEVTALRAMLDRVTYTKYSPVLYKLDNLVREHRLILNTIKAYYDRYRDKRSISIDELTAFFQYQNPSVKNREVLDRIFDQIKTANVDNPELITDILNNVAEQHMCAKITEVALAVTTGTKVGGITEIEELVDKYKEIAGSILDSEAAVCNTSLVDLLKKTKGDGLLWALPFLDRLFGPLNGKRLGHIFARPDAGKTSLALFLACRWAYQLRKTDKCVLYLNNEEDIERIRLRSFCSMCAEPQEWLDANPIEADQRFHERGGERLKFIGGVTHINDVEKHISAFRPRICIIDQGPKIDLYVGKNTSDTAKFQKLYNRFREMAKEYGPDIVTLGQADERSENRKFLGLNNLDSSKVGIPGELDWCIGMGRLHAPEYAGLRFLTGAKNKLRATYLQDSVNFDINSCTFK